MLAVLLLFSVFQKVGEPIKVKPVFSFFSDYRLHLGRLLYFNRGFLINITLLKCVSHSWDRGSYPDWKMYIILRFQSSKTSISQSSCFWWLFQGGSSVIVLLYLYASCCLYAFMSSLRKHAYSNILKISQPKTWNFSDKKFWYFSYFCSKQIDRRSNEYPQSMLLHRNKKIMYTPVNPSFYYIKVGFKGVKII